VAQRLVPSVKFSFLSAWGGLHSTGPAGDRWSPAVSQGKKNSCPQAGGAHREGFKLDSKGEGDVTIEISPGVACQGQG